MTPTIAEPGFAHLLHQADHWATRDDADRLVRIRLDDMSPAHRARVLAWCRNNAEFLHTRALDMATRLHRRGVTTAEEFARHVAELQDVPPPVWLEETVLVRRLTQLTPRRPLAPRGLITRIRARRKATR